MTAEERRAKHAAYMRDYNSRPEAHAKKLLANRSYRERNLAEIQAYDRKRNHELSRRAARYVYGKNMRERRGEECKKYHNEYYAAHREQWKEKSARRRSRFSKEEWSDIQRRYKLKHDYGITVEEYDEMLKAQNGKCALCDVNHGSVGQNGKLHIDHDHRTNKVRGLLCMFCNHAIERIENHNGWAARAEAYLKRPR